jgi:hypothetical protein
MRAVFYPSHCSLRSLVWTAQKRTRLVAKVSASARTSVTFVMRACGITAPPTSAFSGPSCRTGYRRLRQPPQIESGPAGMNALLPHLRQLCHVKRTRHRRARRRSISAAQRHLKLVCRCLSRLTCPPSNILLSLRNRSLLDLSDDSITVTAHLRSSYGNASIRLLPRQAQRMY